MSTPTSANAVLQTGKTAGRWASRKSELGKGAVLFTLLGLSWIFGAMISTGEETSSLIFQYLFVICTCSQGIAVFLLSVAMSNKAREEISSFLSGSRRTMGGAILHSSGAGSGSKLRASQETTRGYTKAYGTGTTDVLGYSISSPLDTSARTSSRLSDPDGT